MTIIEQGEKIISWDVNEQFFRNHQTPHSQFLTESKWITSEANSWKLLYNMFFMAKDPLANDIYISCHKQLNLHCIIEDVKADAKRITSIKKLAVESLLTFIHDKSGMYSHRLDLSKITFSNEHELREQSSLRRALALMPFEQKSDADKKIDQLSASASLRLI